MTPARVLIVTLLALAAMAVAQTSNPPANNQGAAAPAGAQTTPPQPPPPQASITNPKGKRPPSAKTKQEYDQYLAAASAPTQRPRKGWRANSRCNFLIANCCRSCISK